MANDDIFDSGYIDCADNTSAVRSRSVVKTLLKGTTKEEEMAKYGSSKPKRIVIKAKITNG